MAYAPSVGQDGGSCAFDLPDEASEIFLRDGLDRFWLICPSCHFVAGLAGCASSGKSVHPPGASRGLLQVHL